MAQKKNILHRYGSNKFSQNAMIAFAAALFFSSPPALAKNKACENLNNEGQSELNDYKKVWESLKAPAERLGLESDAQLKNFRAKVEEKMQDIRITLQSAERKAKALKPATCSKDIQKYEEDKTSLANSLEKYRSFFTQLVNQQDEEKEAAEKARKEAEEQARKEAEEKTLRDAKQNLKKVETNQNETITLNKVVLSKIKRAYKTDVSSTNESEQIPLTNDYPVEGILVSKVSTPAGNYGLMLQVTRTMEGVENVRKGDVIMIGPNQLKRLYKGSAWPQIGGCHLVCVSSRLKFHPTFKKQSKLV